MARIEIELPEQFVYRTEIPLLGIHMNIGGHLENALLLTLLSEARQRCWEEMGYDVFDIEGVRLIVVDAAVQYISEATRGETMVLNLAFRDFHKYGFDIVWQVSDKDSGREVARGKTGMLSFDAALNKVVLLPEKLKQKVAQLHPQSGNDYHS